MGDARGRGRTNDASIATTFFSTSVGAHSIRISTASSTASASNPSADAHAVANASTSNVSRCPTDAARSASAGARIARDPGSVAGAFLDVVAARALIDAMRFSRCVQTRFSPF
jgi:hypothetical protein